MFGQDEINIFTKTCTPTHSFSFSPLICNCLNGNTCSVTPPLTICELFPRLASHVRKVAYSVLDLSSIMIKYYVEQNASQESYAQWYEPASHTTISHMYAHWVSYSFPNIKIII